MADKLEDLEMRSRRNNMRVFGVLEGTESQSGSVAKFVDTWLQEELGLDTEMQIQRAHRATVPKPDPRQPPRFIVINFQQFSTKELALKKSIKEGWNSLSTPLNKIRIHWENGTRTYGTAAAEATDMENRGFRAEELTTATRTTDTAEQRQGSDVTLWKRVDRNQMAKRARGCRQKFQHNNV